MAFSTFSNPISKVGNASTAAVAVPKLPDINVELVEPPTDSVSSMEFSPLGGFLAVGSWDNAVRIYEVNQQAQSQGKASYFHDGPVLDVCWSSDGSKIFSGGLDSAGRAFDVQTGQTVQVAQHEAPIKSVGWVPAGQSGFLVTGSWDKTIKYWDLRAQTPAASINLPERCYALDIMYPLMVVGTAMRQVQIYDLNNPAAPFKTVESPLKSQTTAIKCFQDAQNGAGYAIGGNEGWIGLQYVDDDKARQCVNFKCHRQPLLAGRPQDQMVFAVNELAFHPVHNTLTSCGSDGVVNVWDRHPHVKLKALDPAPTTVSSICFSRDGKLLACAQTYDWSMGYMGSDPNRTNKVILHQCKDEDFMARPKAGT